MLLLVPSEKFAVTVNCAVCPSALKVTVGEVITKLSGISAISSKLISGTSTIPFGGMVKKSDCPDLVTPFSTHVALTRTLPKPAGTFGMT